MGNTMNSKHLWTHSLIFIPLLRYFTTLSFSVSDFQNLNTHQKKIFAFWKDFDTIKTLKNRKNLECHIQIQNLDILVGLNFKLNLFHKLPHCGKVLETSKKHRLEMNERKKTFNFFSNFRIHTVPEQNSTKVAKMYHFS